jgi:hypothetical protein
MSHTRDRIATIILAHTPSGGEGAEGNVNCWCSQRFSYFIDHAKHVADLIIEFNQSVEDYHGKTIGGQ